MSGSGKLAGFIVSSLIISLVGLIIVLTQNGHPLYKFIGVLLLLLPGVFGAVVELTKSDSDS